LTLGLLKQKWTEGSNKKKNLIYEKDDKMKQGSEVFNISNHMIVYIISVMSFY
jgi:hypothetical protein